MENKEEFLTHFVKQSHEILIGCEKEEQKYQDEFYKPETDTESEYCLNTTTWD